MELNKSVNRFCICVFLKTKKAIWPSPYIWVDMVNNVKISSRLLPTISSSTHPSTVLTQTRSQPYALPVDNNYIHQTHQDNHTSKSSITTSDNGAMHCIWLNSLRDINNSITTCRLFKSPQLKSWTASVV